MSKTVKLTDVLSTDQKPSLERVRLNENETAVVLFTDCSIPVSLHYCEEPEIRDWLHCLETDCILCRIGRKKDERLLVPVYLPVDRVIGVLPLSRSLRPKALLPQLTPALTGGQATVAFITREQSTFTVSTTELPEDAESGTSLIKQFLKDDKAGIIDLASVFPRHDAEQLMSIPRIAELAKLKGVSAK